ncbi:hypothetical protein, conserved [Trypanosoma brucei gambiense DAL972]|uniref:Uncharacterized protein n=2 Tax=Trypanosoma brucei TaxID=5691 RepID=D0A4I2_TRYB9|nr:hypothetical protein, conserved [Trypanosoma brucei gambiense DAL972]RHW69409.1 hypothetical protein DPX39_100111300 [Trypanosoma brucei equiperdum]CBH16176.1 hypothetical protein, conserved [Trypanosoma brucei gambiense DAL972]|eukprot:XP_011778440.1 hypothetical protein, conserved [Trypanosoma brucei gambiense DAL972]
MLDITAIPACATVCSFPLVCVDAISFCRDSSQPSLLLVGHDKACSASVSGGAVTVHRFFPQHHRLLTDGAGYVPHSGNRAVLALADAASTVTLHSVPLCATDNTKGSSGDCSTIFVGEPWERGVYVSKVVPLCGNGGGGADAVCVRKGETGVMWGTSFEYATAWKMSLRPNVDKLDLHRQQYPHFCAGGFVASSRDTLFTFDSHGEAQLQMKIPEGVGPLEAVQGGGSGSPLYAVATGCGTVFLHDARYTGGPLWIQRISGCADARDFSENLGVHTVMMTSNGRDVWAMLLGRKFIFLRCVNGTVTCRSFPSPPRFLFPQFSPAGLLFESNTLHVVGNALEKSG